VVKQDKINENIKDSKVHIPARANLTKTIAAAWDPLYLSGNASIINGNLKDPGSLPSPGKL
jgi:hypothetical protein